MSVHSVRFIVAPNSFPVMPDQIGHLPSAKVVIIIEKRCRSIAFVAQSQTSDPSIPTIHARLLKSRLAKLLEKSESEDFSMIIDNQHITRRKSYAFSHSAKLLYTNFVNEDNRCSPYEEQDLLRRVIV